MRQVNYEKRNNGLRQKNPFTSLLKLFIEQFKYNNKRLFLHNKRFIIKYHTHFHYIYIGN